MVHICNRVNGAISNKVEMFLIALCVFKKNYLKYVTRVTLRSVTHTCKLAFKHTHNVGSDFKGGQILLQIGCCDIEKTIFDIDIVMIIWSIDICCSIEPGRYHL